MTKDWLDMVAYSGLGDRETFEATYDICRAVLERSVPGDMVECGVYAGAQAAIMARAVMDWVDLDGMGLSPLELANAEFPRHVHLFDSFAGIPAPGLHDHELAANVGGESACSLADVKANMKRWGIPDELLVYHVGLFSDTAEWVQGYCDACGEFDVGRESVAGKRTCHCPKCGRMCPLGGLKEIAVLRLDGDLYSSTKVCMEHLYPLVSRGGWVIVDDFNLSGCRKAVMETVVPAPLYFRKPTK